VNIDEAETVIEVDPHEKEMNMGNDEFEPEDLSRKFLIDVTADGACFVRQMNEKPQHGGLPMFSTDTREEAESLIVLHCHLARDGSGIYRINNWPRDADIDAIYAAAALFRASYASRRARAR
jgi:hypothetical protein